MRQPRVALDKSRSGRDHFMSINIPPAAPSSWDLTGKKACGFWITKRFGNSTGYTPAAEERTCSDVTLPRNRHRPGASTNCMASTIHHALLAHTCRNLALVYCCKQVQGINSIVLQTAIQLCLANRGGTALPPPAQLSSNLQ
jgi:hypothetical protein